MGSPHTEQRRSSDEDQHRVRLTRCIEFCVVPVTQALYEAVMGQNPSHFKGPMRPVEEVSWYEAVRFCNGASAAFGLPAAYRIGSGSEPSVEWDQRSVGFRLPTESEWEYAARAGTQHLYAGGDDLDAVGWFSGNSDKQTRPVGLRLSNAWGLHDMSGNVWEWCWDWKGAYAAGAFTDPTGPASGSFRVFRGGSWCSATQYARVAYRDSHSPGDRYCDLGFRLLRTAP